MWHREVVMKPVVQVTRFHYWSERLVEKILDDNVTYSPQESEFQIGISSAGSFKSKSRTRASTRAGKAATVLEILSDHIVRDFQFEGPVDYLTGSTPLVIGPESTHTSRILTARCAK
jgi:hypothetical protein